MKNYNKQYVLANSFVVNDDNLNHESVLSVCNILNAINSLNDQTILALFGTLDFNKIIVKHFDLDIIGKAFLNDLVTVYTYATVYEEDVLEIKVVANKKGRKKNIPIVNGNFVFAVKRGIAVHYSLS